MAEYPATPPQVPPRKRTQHQNYYHPCVKSPEDVKKLMVHYMGKEGAYIIRNSFSKPGSYTVSVMHDDGIKHFNILTNGSYYFVQDQKFHSVEKVVEYFSRHEVPNQEGVRHVRLLYPIACDKCGRSESPISSPGVSRSVSLLTTISESNISTPSGNTGLGSGSATLPRDIKIDTDSIKSGDSGGVILPDPPSPATPIKKQRKSFFPWNRKPKKNSKNEIEVKDMSQRPPCPLPPHTHRPSEVVYDYATNSSVNRLPELIQMLRLTTEQGMEKCECGLTVEESELPSGWSMHISHDVNTRGRLFFMGPQGETSWNMPLEVSLEMGPDDQDRVKRVKAKCDDLQMRFQMQRTVGGNLPASMSNSSMSVQRQFSNSPSAQVSSFSGSSGALRSSSGDGFTYRGSSGSGFSEDFGSAQSLQTRQFLQANAAAGTAMNGFQTQPSLLAQIPTTVQDNLESTLLSAAHMQQQGNVYIAEQRSFNSQPESYRYDSRSSSIPSMPAPSLPSMQPVPNNPERRPAQHNDYTGSTTGVSPLNTISLPASSGP